jgi:hypothetical protein
LSDQGRGFERRGRRTARKAILTFWKHMTRTGEEELRLGLHVPDFDEELLPIWLHYYGAVMGFRQGDKLRRID